jgi:hypothetical protein
VIETQDIPRRATVLPEVEETSHVRFRAPEFKVRAELSPTSLRMRQPRLFLNAL